MRLRESFSSCDSSQPTMTTKMDADASASTNSDCGNGSGRHGVRSSRGEYPMQVKLLACSALVSVQVFAATVLKVAQKDGKYSFNPQSSLVMSETIKTVLSGLYLLGESRSPRVARRQLQEESSRPLALHMFGLALVYCFNNALMFWLFARADPGSITLIKSGATLVSAVMLYFWRRFKLSISRWLVITMQMLGLIIAQYDACVGKAHLPAFVYSVLLLSLFNSSSANVWNEHVIKTFHGAGLATKNIYLYFFGALLNLVVFQYMRLSDPTTPAFFEGYNLPALGVVTSNAFMGIAMNLVYKYADALIKNIATTTTTVILLIISAFFFGGRSNPMVFLGAGVVVVGTFLYFSLGISEAKYAELQKTIAQAGTK